MALKVLSQSDWLEAQKRPENTQYLAMYSSLWQGVVTDPQLMVLPIDDHIVHRGDGVFEAIKVMQGRPYLLDAHLDRLEKSAQLISLPMPFEREQVKAIISDLCELTQTPDLMLRLYVSRGPGGFSTNPYECPQSALYLVATRFNAFAAEKYEQGVRIGRSEYRPKDAFFARIKSCNYLLNVLMKKESVDRNLDFTVGYSVEGFLTESSTENIVVLDREGCLCRPRLHQILRGTTMMRLFEMAEEFVGQEIAGVQERDLTEQDILEAREVMMVGTTLDVLPVVQYEGQNIGSGKVGPVAQKLLARLQKDILDAC